ncbi:MAG: tetratricopeptide repeat protein [Oceanidesulfovibrio sp.]
MFNNKETAFLVKQIKNAFSDIKVVILTGETERQRLVLLHEIGADNFISKPISMNILIEKIAFTIKPQGKIGKLIDNGKQLLSKEQYEESLKVVRQILEIKPNSAAGFLIMGDAYKGLGKKDKAVEAYENACEHAAMYMEPLKKLAEFYEEEGDHENRLRYLEKLDKLSPLNVERKVDMGGIHVNLGNEEKAELLFEHAINQAKKEAMNYIEEITSKIGGIYEKHDPDKAVKYYRKAIDLKGDMLDKSDIKIFNSLGIALRRQGKWREAVDEYTKARTVSPEDENLLYNIALAYAEGKEMRKSTESLAKALELNPEFHMQDPVIAYNFGLIYSKARKPDDARIFLEAALSLNPGFEKAQKLLDSL